MSVYERTKSSCTLYDEGADPEADLVLVCGDDHNVAAAAFALDKLLTEEPNWPCHVMTAMVRLILPRTWYSSGRKLEVITDHVKGLHASTTVALFQHVARKFYKAACYDLQKQDIGKVVEYALHEQEHE